MVNAELVEGGLLIPRRLLKKLGTDSYEVLTREHEIVIRPKTKTRQYYGFMGIADHNEELIKELENDFEESGND